MKLTSNVMRKGKLIGTIEYDVDTSKEVSDGAREIELLEKIAEETKGIR